MNVKIEPSAHFKRQVKRLFKRYRSIPSLLEMLEETLSENPFLGTPLGKGFFKIRLAIPEKNKGKSGGLRVITNVILLIEENKEGEVFVLLTSIYDKSEKDSVSDKELQAILKDWQL